MTWHKTGHAVSNKCAMGKAECSWRWAIDIKKSLKPALPLQNPVQWASWSQHSWVCFPGRLLSKGWQLYCCTSVVGEQLSPVRHRTGCSVSILIFWVLGSRDWLPCLVKETFPFTGVAAPFLLIIKGMETWNEISVVIFSFPFKKMQQIASYYLRGRSFTSGILPVLDCGLELSLVPVVLECALQNTLHYKGRHESHAWHRAAAALLP